MASAPIILSKHSLNTSPRSLHRRFLALKQPYHSRPVACYQALATRDVCAPPCLLVPAKPIWQGTCLFTGSIQPSGTSVSTNLLPSADEAIALQHAFGRPLCVQAWANAELTTVISPPKTNIAGVRIFMSTELTAATATNLVPSADEAIEVHGARGALFDTQVVPALVEV